MKDYILYAITYAKMKGFIAIKMEFEGIKMFRGIRLRHYQGSITVQSLN